MALENRKQELLEELNKIRAKEVEEKLINLESTEGSAYAQLTLEKSKSDHELEHRLKEAEIAESKAVSASHRFIMKGDFFIKFLIAVTISAAFMYVVWQGSMNPSQKALLDDSPDYFSLLSVLGPLFGAMVQYYFGSKKKSANGE